MAFESKNFIICSRFPLFRASGNLWMYRTLDSLETILADVDSDGYSLYFRPRENLKNHDSPNEGDVILLFVEDSKLAYLKIVGKVEKPYKIKVARTYLENESTLLALITELQLDKASKSTDFATPITDDNLGITQEEQSELEGKIDLAANSGRMITPQGVWYAKMESDTVPPSADNGTNYADFTQTDLDGNPIIVIYERQSGAWVQVDTITPPAEYDGYVPITSKIWDIPEQAGQQGGRILWNHTSEQFTAYPSIVSFDNISITGNSTVEVPQNPTDNNIANVGYVKTIVGGARNVGDVFFTMRKDNEINGAVACDGGTYNTTDFTGAQSIENLLSLGKIPYVSLSTYETLLSTNGSVGVFGWDGIGTTAFRVPSLNDIFVETGTAAQVGDYLAPAIPNVKAGIPGVYFINGQQVAVGAAKITNKVNNNLDNTSGTGETYAQINIDASLGSGVYKNDVDTVQPKSIRYRAMVQLATRTTDQAIETCTSVLSDIADLKNQSDFRVLTMPTADASNLGVIYQYTGETDANYTNGYFYKCVSDGQNPPTYSWTAVQVQAGGGGSLPSQTGNAGKFLTTDGTDASWASAVATTGGTMSGDLYFTRINNISTSYRVVFDEVDPVYNRVWIAKRTALNANTGDQLLQFYGGKSASVQSDFYLDFVKKAFFAQEQYSTLGTEYYPWNKIYVSIINNGADINVPAQSGTMVVATPPAIDGTYVLKATVSSGVVTYSWVSE